MACPEPESFKVVRSWCHRGMAVGELLAYLGRQELSPRPVYVGTNETDLAGCGATKAHGGHVIWVGEGGPEEVDLRVDKFKDLIIVVEDFLYVVRELGLGGLGGLKAGAKSPERGGAEEVGWLTRSSSRRLAVATGAPELGDELARSDEDVANTVFVLCRRGRATTGKGGPSRSREFLFPPAGGWCQESKRRRVVPQRGFPAVGFVAGASRLPVS